MCGGVPQLLVRELTLRAVPLGVGIGREDYVGVEAAAVVDGYGLQAPDGAAGACSRGSTTASYSAPRRRPQDASASQTSPYHEFQLVRLIQNPWPVCVARHVILS